MLNPSHTTKICYDITLKPELLKELATTVDGKALTFYTYPGVFSYRKPDPGTLLLGRNLPETKPGKILDLGCGSGLLSLIAHLRYPHAEIHAVDIDPRAVALSELNFKQFPNLAVWGSNLFDQIVDRDYDLIITNIPAKPTKEVHTEIIEESFTHLSQDGRLYIVAAGRLFKYLQRLIDSTFDHSAKIARNKTHTVIAAYMSPE